MPSQASSTVWISIAPRGAFLLLPSERPAHNYLRRNDLKGIVIAPQLLRSKWRQRSGAPKKVKTQSAKVIRTSPRSGRNIVAHGASRGKIAPHPASGTPLPAVRGEGKGVRGGHNPRAHARGYMMPPLRGWSAVNHKIIARVLANKTRNYGIAMQSLLVHQSCD